MSVVFSKGRNLPKTLGSNWAMRDYVVVELVEKKGPFHFELGYYSYNSDDGKDYIKSHPFELEADAREAYETLRQLISSAFEDQDEVKAFIEHALDNGVECAETIYSYVAKVDITEEMIFKLFKGRSDKYAWDFLTEAGLISLRDKHYEEKLVETKIETKNVVKKL